MQIFKRNLNMMFVFLNEVVMVAKTELILKKFNKKKLKYVYFSRGIFPPDR